MFRVFALPVQRRYSRIAEPGDFHAAIHERNPHTQCPKSMAASAMALDTLYELLLDLSVVSLAPFTLKMFLHGCRATRGLASLAIATV